MEKIMTPEESLQVIQKTISNSRRNMREGSFYYVLWGWALILASLANYAMLKYYIQKEIYTGLWWKSFLVWMIFLVIGTVIQRIRIARTPGRDKVITHLDRYITILWLTSGAIMGLMVFLAYMVDSYPVPFILGITALATFVSGMMVRYIPLIIGGFVFLIASVIAIYIGGLEQLLIFAGAMVLGYLVPGYMLRTIKNGNDV